MPTAIFAALLLTMSVAGCQSTGYGGSSASSDNFEEPYNSASYLQGYDDAGAVANDSSMYLYSSTYGGDCSFMASQWSGSGEISDFSESEYIQGCEAHYIELGWTKTSSGSSSDSLDECEFGYDDLVGCLPEPHDADSDKGQGNDSSSTDSESQNDTEDSTDSTPPPITWKMTSSAITEISALLSQYIQYDSEFICPTNTVLTFGWWFTKCSIIVTYDSGNVKEESTYTGISESLEGVTVKWGQGYNVYYKFPEGPLE